MDEDLADKIADVQKSVEKLAAQVSKLASKKIEAGMETEAEMFDSAKEGVKKATKMGKEKAEEINDMVADNPWLVIAVVSVAALAIGHLVGYAKGKE